MKMTYIIIGIVVGLLLFIAMRKTPKTTSTPDTTTKTETKPTVSGKEVIDKLDELGYFKYADPADIDEIKKEMTTSFDEHNVLNSPIDDETLKPKDLRQYFCDGEELFELGGLTYYLGQVKPTFEKMGLRLNWTDETDNFEGDNWDHRITLNGQEYPAFVGNMNSMDVWGIAAKNYVAMLNDQLEKQGSDERVYPISGGNDGQIIFLTNEQYKYIKTVYKDDEFSPLPLTEWCKRNGLK